MTNQAQQMPVRHAVGMAETRIMDTARFRETFLLDTLFSPGDVRAVYTHYDRMVAGGAMPADTPLELPVFENLKANTFWNAGNWA